MSHLHKSLNIPADREAMITKACAVDETIISAGDPHVPQEEKAFRMIREALELERSRINEIRATLLVNFGEKSDRNRFGFGIKDDGRPTLALLVEVLEKLTGAPSAPEKGEGVAVVSIPPYLMNTDVYLHARQHAIERGYIGTAMIQQLFIFRFGTRDFCLLGYTAASSILERLRMDGVIGTKTKPGSTNLYLTIPSLAPQSPAAPRTPPARPDWLRSEDDGARCGFVPPTPGYAPCTRAKGHDGPCAHEVAREHRPFPGMTENLD